MHWEAQINDEINNAQLDDRWWNEPASTCKCDTNKQYSIQQSIMKVLDKITSNYGNALCPIFECFLS